jgi:hypothetical protein
MSRICWAVSVSIVTSLCEGVVIADGRTVGKLDGGRLAQVAPFSTSGRAPRRRMARKDKRAACKDNKQR